MNVLITGLIIFFAVHSISIVNDPWRNRMQRAAGPWIWKGVYSLVAIIGFVLIIRGYILAGQNPILLYAPPPWLHYPALILLLPVFPLLLAVYLPGRLQTLARHPMLVATMLWAVAHLLINGRLSDLLLFGAFGIWASLDFTSLQGRVPHPVPALPPTAFNDVIAIILGLGLYAAFLFGVHDWLIGVPVLPAGLL